MKIAISWCTEDIKSIRPHLSNGQCDEVLTRAQTTHDANIGLNWEVFGNIADEMFPACEYCNGSGRDNKDEKHPCDFCDGSGLAN